MPLKSEENLMTEQPKSRAPVVWIANEGGHDYKDG